MPTVEKKRSSIFNVTRVAYSISLTFRHTFVLQRKDLAMNVVYSRWMWIWRHGRRTSKNNNIQIRDSLSFLCVCKAQ